MFKMKHAVLWAAIGLVVALSLGSATRAAQFSARPMIVGSIPGGAEKYFTVNLAASSSAQQVHGVAAYFRSFGLQVTEDPADKLLFVHGDYAQAAAAGHTAFALLQDTHQRFAGLSSPERYPDNVARLILSTTMNDGPTAISLGMIAPQGVMGPPSGFTTAEVAKYYDIQPIYTAGIKGGGIKVAILACGTVTTGDITKFESDNALTSNLPTIVSVDGGSTTTELEPTGDVERVVGTAPAVTLTLYVLPANCTLGNLADGMAKINSDDATKKYAVVSHSYGVTEDYYDSTSSDSDMTSEDTDLSGLMAKNTTVFVASGDWGAFTPFSQLVENGEVTVLFPASDPNVLAVGGTDAMPMSPTNATRFQELAWGDSGGGVSDKWAIPTWQKTIKGIASTTMRNVPDVALDASCGTPYMAVWTPSGGTQGNYGFCGTSFAAPTWAGLLALVDNGRVSGGKKKLTAVISTLYSKHGTAGMFVDMTTGDNGYYVVGPKYDDVTGFGVPDADVLYNTLTALP